MAEVGAPCHEGNLVIEAGLCDQSVCQLRLVAAIDGPRSQAPGTFPVAWLQGEDGDLKQCYLELTVPRSRRNSS